MVSRLSTNLVGIAVIACAAPSVAAPRLWTTPDGRYVAAFPATPEEFRFEIQGGAGVGYKALEATPDGEIVYSLTVTVASQIQRRPPESQIREILAMTADKFLKAVGATDVQPYTWATLGSLDAVLNCEGTYVKDGKRILTRGSFVMDDISTVSISLTHAANLPKARRDSVASFLTTLMVRTDQKALPVRDFVGAVATGAGGHPTTCAPGLAESSRKGISKQGGTFIAMDCFWFDEDPEAVQNRLEAMMNKLALGSRRGTWKPRGGALVQTSAYGNDGVGWWVIPPAVLPSFGFEGTHTVVMTEMMR